MSTDNDLRIDYIELGVPDAAEARRFYAAAFGWSFQEYGPEYVAFSDGRLNGGFQADGSTKPGALVILYAKDLEAAQARVEAAGGVIVKPIWSFPGGRRFHFRDPAGNELAVWSDTGVAGHG
jgi:hypothetical protein